MLVRELEFSVKGKPRIEIDRNVQEDSYRRTKRSTSSEIKATSYVEFPEQVIVQCEDKGQRNNLLQVVTERIKYFQDIISRIFIPPDRRTDRSCDCFNIESFDNEGDKK